jgi:hypothetical protein
MRFDKLTLKAQEAVQEAQNIAGMYNQQDKKLLCHVSNPLK